MVLLDDFSWGHKHCGGVYMMFFSVFIFAVIVSLFMCIFIYFSGLYCLYIFHFHSLAFSFIHSLPFSLLSLSSSIVVPQERG